MDDLPIQPALKQLQTLDAAVDHYIEAKPIDKETPSIGCRIIRYSQGIKGHELVEDLVGQYG